MKKTVALFTLGCKVNQSESQQLLEEFLEQGWLAAEFDQPADVYVINTCTVTQAADQKSRKMIRGAKRRNPAAFLAVTGCYGETGGGDLKALEEIDLLIPNRDKAQAVKLIEAAWRERQKKEKDKISSEFSPSDKEQVCREPVCVQDTGLPHLRGLNRTRATLKIQDGCRQFCTYCIIPYARGSWQSLPAAEVLTQAGRLAEKGAGEIVLLGIHLGAYGWERGEREGLAEVLEQLLIRFPHTRFRLGSLEPMEASPRLIGLIRDYPNACKHLHLPLQCGQDRILKAMNRPYTTADYRRKAAEVRQALPELALTTDVMTGFPGETAEEFEECCRFVREMAFSRLHVFAYSRRPGTPAADMPGQVPKGIREERSRRLIALGQELGREYAGRFQGRELEVLAEEELFPGFWRGTSDNYLDVGFFAPAQDRDLRGKLLRIHFLGEEKEGLWSGQLL